MKIRLFIVTLLSFNMLACVGGKRDTSKETTPEEKAAIYLRMGTAYMELGRLNNAKEELENALKWDSNSADVHNALAVLNERIQRPEEASHHYQLAVDLAPENYSVKNNYGRFLCDKGEYEKGLAHLNTALSMPLNERKWFSLTNAGICKLKQGIKNEAEAYFRQALILNPTYAPALLEMQKLSYHNGKYMSARAFLQRYLNVAQHNPVTLWYAYQTERAMGNPDLAETYKQQLYSKFPNSTQSMQLKSVDH